MKRKQNRKARMRRRARRRRLGGLLYRMLCVTLVVCAGLTALTIFFKVEAVEVSGDTRYSHAVLQNTLGAQVGENLFFWGRRAGVERLRKEYPYLDAVKVEYRLPGTVVLHVTECVPVARLQDQAGDWFLIDRAGKVLEQTTEDTLPPVTGVASILGTPGLKAAFTEEGAGEALKSLLTVLTQKEMLEQIDFINLTDLTALHIGYQGRFDVRLGTPEALERKLDYLALVVGERLSPSDQGVIDLSAGATTYYWPATAEQIAEASGLPTDAAGAASAADEPPQDDGPPAA